MGRKAMNEIRIDVNNHGSEVRGFLGRREVISMNRHVQGEWIVGSSSCLPTDRIRNERDNLTLQLSGGGYGI
jgi:hypothetical protein